MNRSVMFERYKEYIMVRQKKCPVTKHPLKKDNFKIFLSKENEIAISLEGIEVLRFEKEIDGKEFDELEININNFMENIGNDF